MPFPIRSVSPVWIKLVALRIEEIIGGRNRKQESKRTKEIGNLGHAPISMHQRLVRHFSITNTCMANQEPKKVVQGRRENSSSGQKKAAEACIVDGANSSRL